MPFSVICWHGASTVDFLQGRLLLGANGSLSKMKESVTIGNLLSSGRPMFIRRIFSMGVVACTVMASLIAESPSLSPPPLPPPPVVVTFQGPTTLADRTFDTLIIEGSADLERVKVKNLKVNGPVRFFDLEVSGATELNGPTKGRKAFFNSLTVKGFLKAKEVKIETLNVDGPVRLWWFTILGDSTINGRLKAMEGSFQNLRVGSKSGGDLDVFLENVTAKELFINAGAAPEVVTLSGRVMIDGPLTFESGRGRIVTKGNQVEIKGVNGCLPGE
jgi:hypothetical protein